MIPKGSYIQDGLWKIRLIPEEIRDGQYDLWLPAGMALNRETRFFGGIAGHDADNPIDRQPGDLGGGVR